MIGNDLSKINWKLDSSAI